MARDIVETEKIEDEQYLNEVTARLEKESDSITELDTTGREPETSLRYHFDDEIGNGDTWYGHIEIEIYDQEEFQARGDEVLLKDYFLQIQIQEI